MAELPPLERTKDDTKEALDLGSDEILDSVDLLRMLVNRISDSIGSGSSSEEKTSPETSKVVASKDELMGMVNDIADQFEAEGRKRSSVEAMKLKAIAKELNSLNLAQALEKASELIRDLRPFDIVLFDELLRLTEQSSDALKGQYCWLFCGPTGAGKSTTIHYCAGSKMVRLEDSEHITFSEITNAALRSLPEDAIKPGQNLSISQTRYIAAVPLDLGHIPGVSLDESKVMLVDSPGFGDSNGAEVDLANRLGMVRALKKAKRVKVIVVMSRYNYSSRMAGVKRLTSDLCAVMPNFEAVLQKHSALFFTKGDSSSTAESVRKQFKTVLGEQQSQEREGGQPSLPPPKDFRVFAQCLQSGALPVECVFPLEPERHDSLFRHLVDNSSVSWIRNPRREFVETINGDSLASIKSQFVQYKGSIRRFCELGLNEERCALISRYLALMRRVCKNLPNNEALLGLLRESEDVAIRAWNSVVSGIKKALDSLESVTLARFTQSLDECEQKYKELSSARLRGLMSRVHGLDAVNILVNGCVDRLVKSLSMTGPNDPWRESIPKLQALVNRYSEQNPLVRSKFDSALRQWREQVDVACKQGRQYILQGQWKELVSQLVIITRLSEMVALANSEETDADCARQSRQLCRDLKKYLYSSVSDACRTMDFGVRGMDEIDSLGSSHGSEISMLSDGVLPATISSLGVFDTVKITAALKDFNNGIEVCVDTLQRSAKISPDFGITAQNVQSFFWAELIRYCKECLLQPAESLLTGGGGGGSWKRCNEFIDRCEVIRSVATRVQNKTSDRYFRLRSTFQSKINEVLSELKEMLDDCNQSEDSVDGESTPLNFRRLVDCVNNLSDAGLPKDDPRMKMLIGKVVEFIDNLQKRADRLHLTVQRSELLDEVKDLMYQLSQLTQLHNNMPDLKKQCDELFSGLKVSLVYNLSQIESKFDVESRALEHLSIEREALKELGANLTVFSKSASKEQYSMVYDCRTPDLTTQLVDPISRKLENLAAKRESTCLKKTEREGKVGKELEDAESVRSRVVQMIEVGVSYDSLLKSKGFRNLADVKNKIEDLSERLKNLCPDLINEIERIDKEMRALTADKEVICGYIRSEEACLARYKETMPNAVVWWSEYRCNKPKAQERLIDLDRRLITGDKYDFEQLDLFLSVHSLLFVERARSINLRMDVSDEIASALESAEGNLREYLVRYGECWNNRFNRELQACIQLSDDCKSTEGHSGDAALIERELEEERSSDLEDGLITRCELFNSTLRELQKICEVELRDGDGTRGQLCTAVFGSPLERKVGEIYDKLCTIHTSLSNRLANGAASLREEIANLCFELSIVDDSFIRYAVRVTGSPERKFNEIQAIVRTETGREISDLKSGVIRSFNEELLTELEDQLSKLQELSEAGHQRVYNIVCSSVTHKLSEQYTDASGLALQVSEMMSDLEMHQLNEQLRKLESLARVVRPHLSDSMKQTIEEKASELKMKLAARMKDVVDSVLTAAANSSFDVAERRLGTAVRFNQYLQGAVGAMLDADTKQELTEQLKNARTAINKSVETLLKGYDEIDLVNEPRNPFSRLRPRHVYTEMKLVSDKYPAYRSHWDGIAQCIGNKFLEACERVKGEEKTEEIVSETAERTELSVPLTYLQRRTILRRLETYLKWLPKELEDQLTFDIEEAQKTFDESAEEHQSTMTQALDNESWEVIAVNLDTLDTVSPTLRTTTLSRLSNTATELSRQLIECVAEEVELNRDSLRQCKEILQKTNSYSQSLLGLESVNFTGKQKAKEQLQNSVDKMISVFAGQCESTGDSLSQISDKNIHFIDGSLTFFAGMSSYLSTAELSRILYTEMQKGIVKRVTDKLIARVDELVERLIGKKKEVLVNEDVDRFGEVMDDLHLLQKESTVLSSIQELSELDVSDLSYDHTVCEVTKLLSDRRDMIVEMGLDNEKTRENEARRRAHFAAIQVGFQWFVSVKVWADKHLSIQPESDLIQPSILKIRKDSKNLCNQAKSVMDSQQLCYDNLNEFNTSLEILKCCAEFIPGDLFDNQDQIVECRKKLVTRIESVKNAAMHQGIPIETLAEQLIELQKMKEWVGIGKKSADDAISTVINFTKTHSRNRIVPLSTKLTDTDPDIAASLIREQPAFVAALIKMKARRMIEIPIERVLEEIKGYQVEFDKDRLMGCFETAHLAYDRALQRYLHPVESFNKIKWDRLVNEILDIQRKSNPHELPGESGGSSSFFGGVRKRIFGDSKKKDEDSSVPKSGYWTQEMIENIPELVGLIFALWTLKNSKAYFDSESEDGDDTDNTTFLLQPRVAQYVSVFCLLGLDEKEDARPEGILVNNLVEIGTGEGKSITLAVTSAVLALLGFDVSCGCFSLLLSERDYKSFEDIFDTLNVSPYIHYGTFNGLFERILNNRMNLRRSVEDMLSDKNLFNEADDVKGDGDSGEDQKEQRPTILLIDEVDVFFQEDFFGALYSVSTIYKNDAFANLIRWVWEKKKKATPVEIIPQSEDVKDEAADAEELAGEEPSEPASAQPTESEDSKASKPFVWNEDEFLGSAAFEAVKKEFVAEWHPLLEEAMKDIFDAAKTSEDDQSYVVCDGRIGYKFQDSVSFKAFKGYKTMFAYLKEYDEGRVSEDALNRNLGFFVKIASFSYAEVPQTFSAILGVTGTLRTLTDKERSIMERDYRIIKHVYNPSLFGLNRLIFRKNSDTKCVDRENYESQLTESIKRARDSAGFIKRPILVIFEDEQHLKRFEKSTHFTNYLLAIGDKFKLILTEDLNDTEKNVRIKQAVSKGTITLTTASFGRGIDFQVYNDTIDANGGMHVECAFLPHSKSEEVQFRGRTARQGRHGSFGMTIDIQNCLAKFRITAEDIQAIAKEEMAVGLYDFIDEKRNDRFAAAYEEMASVVKSMRPIHEEAEEFVAAMESRDWRKAAQMLIARNEGAFLGNTARMCIVIDATASMGPLMNQVKNVLQLVIPQLQIFLLENEKDKNMFQIQIIYYRNYNAPVEYILHTSGYTSEVTVLTDFMNGVKAGYGWGSEASELGLAYVAGLADQPHFVLLIGDAASNEDLEIVKWKRKEGPADEQGESYWQQYPQFAEPTYWEEQVGVLADNQVQINTFYLKENVASESTKKKKRRKDVLEAQLKAKENFEKARLNFEEIAKRTGGVSRELKVEDTESSTLALTGAVADQVLAAIDGGKGTLLEAYHAKHADVPSFL